MNGKQICRPGAPRQALHGGTAVIDNDDQRQKHSHDTTVAQRRGNASPKPATCSVCGGSLTVPFIAMCDGRLIHARCQFARRDALPSSPARRVNLRSRVRGVSAIVASLALETQGEDARALSQCAYELARVAAGLKAVTA